MSRKLLVAAGIFHPEAGGPATYLYEILPALQAQGWQVRVLTYGEGDVSAYPYPVQRIPRRVLPLRLLEYARHARAELTQADLVYAHTIDLPLWGSRRAPRLIKIVGDQAWERCMRKAWIAPECDIDDFQQASLGARVEAQRASRSRQVQAMDGVIVPSQYLKQMVMGWGVPQARIHVIYNALPELSEALPSKAELRRDLGISSAPTLLTAARLTRWKGVDHLIQALKAVPEAQLLVAGDGDDLPRLRGLAQALGERVRFLGRLPRPLLYRYMRAVDYFVLYSGYEGLSHTLLESLRVGTPVIASAKGGNPEVVQTGINGFLVPYVNVSALIETLRTAFQADTAERLARHAQLDETRFAFATMLRETHAILSHYAKA